MAGNMFRAATLGAVLVCAGGVAWAQQDTVFSPGATLACLHQARDGRAAEGCAGLSANQCMLDTPQGDTTYGMSLCFSAEADWWASRMTDVYARRLAKDRALDAEMKAAGRTTGSAAQALKDMHTAWLVYRTARCAYEQAQWMGGTGGGPATAACDMVETARHVLILEARIGQ